MEQLGAEGNVEESQKVMDEVEKARAKKREAEVKFVCLFGWLVDKVLLWDPAILERIKFLIVVKR